jgi:hypothetical protein
MEQKKLIVDINLPYDACSERRVLLGVVRRELREQLLEARIAA